MYSIARVMRANSRLSRKGVAIKSAIGLAFISMAVILRVPDASGDPILALALPRRGIARKAFQQHGRKLRQTAASGIRDVEDGDFTARNHPVRAAIVVGDSQGFITTETGPRNLHARF